MKSYSMPSRILCTSTWQSPNLAVGTSFEASIVAAGTVFCCCCCDCCCDCALVVPPNNPPGLGVAKAVLPNVPALGVAAAEAGPVL